ncbi:MAG: Co2+/Mg2+ efflux protein ApaG [Caulobacteraceae bacterium]|nr:Co2+/Mg2+ efflux protein ApaG [Caulobacteraceae bacterium]
MYEARTRDVVVRVKANYEPGQSDPSENRYFWNYIVEIENHGQETVQLVSRRWVITDARNHSEVVSGRGVVGEQPTLRGREAFRYVSGCPLETPSGAMSGVYQMITDGGDAFEAEIPQFSLHMPGASKKLN